MANSGSAGRPPPLAASGERSPKRPATSPSPSASSSSSSPISASSSVSSSQRPPQAVFAPLKSGRQRNKSSRACDYCRSKKVRCDSIAGTRCTHCIRASLPCSFDREPHKRGPARRLSQPPSSLGSSPLLQDGSNKIKIPSQATAGAAVSSAPAAATPQLGTSATSASTTTTTASSSSSSSTASMRKRPRHLPSIDQRLDPTWAAFSSFRAESPLLVNYGGHHGNPGDQQHQHQHQHQHQQHQHHHSAIPGMESPARPILPPINRLDFPPSNSQRPEGPLGGPSASSPPQLMPSFMTTLWPLLDAYYAHVHPVLSILPHSQAQFVSMLSACPQPYQEACITGIYGVVQQTRDRDLEVRDAITTFERCEQALARISSSSTASNSYYPVATPAPAMRTIRLICLVLMVVQTEGLGPLALHSEARYSKSHWIAAANAYAHSLKLHVGRRRRASSVTAENMGAISLSSSPAASSNINTESELDIARRAWMSCVLVDRLHAAACMTPVTIPDSAITAVVPDSEVLINSAGKYSMWRIALLLGSLPEQCDAAVSRASSPAEVRANMDMLTKQLRKDVMALQAGIDAASGSNTASLHYAKRMAQHAAFMVEAIAPSADPFLLLASALRAAHQLEGDDGGDDVADDTSSAAVLVHTFKHHSVLLAAVVLLALIRIRETESGARAGLQRLAEFCRRTPAATSTAAVNAATFATSIFPSPASPPSPLSYPECRYPTWRQCLFRLVTSSGSSTGGSGPCSSDDRLSHLADTALLSHSKMGSRARDVLPPLHLHGTSTTGESAESSRLPSLRESTRGPSAVLTDLAQAIMTTGFMTIACELDLSWLAPAA